MTAKTRIGVVGTGYLGRLHARVLTEMPEVDVAGFVDAKDATAAEVSEKLGLRRFESAAALAKEIDCAVVASELLEAGCDVLVEKPITANAEEARRLIALAAEERAEPASDSFPRLRSGAR